MPAPSTPPSGLLAGLLERADQALISGWAMDRDTPDRPVVLELLIDGQPVGTLTADLPRDDLRAAGLGEGRNGFQLNLPQGIEPGAVVRLRRLADAAELDGSPRRIEAADGNVAEDGAAEASIAEVLAAAAAAPDLLDDLIARLAREAAALLFADGRTIAGAEASFIARFAAHADRLPAALDDRPRALFIDEGVPNARRDAGSNAAISHMRALGRAGYQVHFVAGYGLDQAGAATAALQAMGVTCWHAPWIASVEEVLKRLGGGLSLVYLHRFGVMQRYAALVRRWCPVARLVYCVADLHYLRLQRQQAVQAGVAVLDAPATPESDGLRTAELLAALGANAVITHSAFEQALLAREAPEAAVHLAAWDVSPDPVETPFVERQGVGFIGSYGHAPNRDAAHMLVQAVMPLVWAAAPALPCVLAGSNFPASLRAAAAAAAGPVIVLGEIDAARAMWERVRLSAAPLRFGAGLKGKVLDSLAAGIPCLCSEMAAEGMRLPESLMPLVCPTPAAMAAQIIALHADATANATLAAAGLAWVAEALSEASIDDALALAFAVSPSFVQAT